jgi:predicted phosphodiesterase|tara:strand:- start:312 stop:1067 length:756 start_codon:yes stop_codon:yes gene_type:complete
MKRAVVFPDQHYPIHDVKAMNVAHQVLEKVKPDIFINLGDVGEWESVSSHKYKKKKRPPLEFILPNVEQEVEYVNKELDKVDAILDKVGCKERHICQGNHDEWLDKFVEENPYLDHLTFRKACYWDKRGFKFKKYNEVLTIGKLSFIHGAYTGPTHAKKHLESYGTNLLYGHVHDLQRHSMTRLKDGAISAWSLGCLKDMRAEKNTWLRGRLHNWNHAVAIIDFWKNGNFAVQIVEIVKGKTVLNGEEIVG